MEATQKVNTHFSSNHIWDAIIASAIATALRSGSYDAYCTSRISIWWGYTCKGILTVKI